MKGRLFSIFLCSTGLVWSQDVLHLHSGDAVSGKIEKLDLSTVQFKVIIDGPRGRGESRRRVARKDIAFIDFAESERDTEDPRRQWLKHQPYLAVANSPAGDFGLTYLAQLITDKKAKEALDIATKIERADWDVERRARAKQWRLKALALAGRGKEAKAEALKILEETQDPELTVEARQILGHAAFESLRELVEAHPRWMDDDEVRPQRDVLFHEALDHFIFGSLFHGSLTEPAARGLWQVCEIYQHAEMPEKAQAVAADLLKLYPNAAECERARQYLDDFSNP